MFSKQRGISSASTSCHTPVFAMRDLSVTGLWPRICGFTAAYHYWLCLALIPHRAAANDLGKLA